MPHEQRRHRAFGFKGGRALSWIKVRQCDYRVEERGWRQAVDRFREAAVS